MSTLTQTYESSPFAKLKILKVNNDTSIFTNADNSDYAKQIETANNENGVTTIQTYPDDKSVVGPWRLRPSSGGQPYLEIFPYDSPTVKRLNSLGNQTLPIGAGARDVARIAQFLISPPGVEFLATQTLLHLDL